MNWMQDNPPSNQTKAKQIPPISLLPDAIKVLMGKSISA